MAKRVMIAAVALLLVSPAWGRAQAPSDTLSVFAEQLMETLQEMHWNPDGIVFMLDVRKSAPEAPAYSVPATPGRAELIREIARAAGIGAIDVFEEMSCPEGFEHPNDCHFPDHARVVVVRLEELEISSDSARLNYKYFVQERNDEGAVLVLNRWVGFTNQEGTWVLTEPNPLVEY